MNELDDLLDIIPVPPTDAAADVARVARSLRRRRRTQVSAVVVGVATLAVVGAALQGSPGSPGAAGYVGGGGGSTESPAPHHRLQAARRHVAQMEARARLAEARVPLKTYRDVLAEHLDPAGTHLHLAQNEQGGAGAYGTKLDWNHGGMLEIVVGRSWGAAGSFYGLETAGLTPTTYAGHPARVSTRGADLVVSAEHEDGTIVTLIASTSFGNNGTSTPSLGLTRHQLLAAAAHPRLVLPRD